MNQSMLTSASLDVTPIRITLDYPAIRRLLTTYDVIAHHSSIDYEKDVVDELSELQSQTVFFTSNNSSLFGNDPSVESIYSLFQSYHDSSESSPPPSSIPFVPTSKMPANRRRNSHVSSESEFQSIVSDDGTEFHSVAETQRTGEGEEEDFRSIVEDSSVMSPNEVKSESDKDSFSSISTEKKDTSHLSSFPSNRIRKDSFFSVTSATHSILNRRIEPRPTDSFLSVGNAEGENLDDYQSIVQSSIVGGASSITQTAAHRSGMNLNVGLESRNER